MNWLRIWTGWIAGGFIFLFLYMKILEVRYSVLKTVALQLTAVVMSGLVRMWGIHFLGFLYYPLQGVLLLVIEFGFVLAGFQGSFNRKVIVFLLVAINSFIAEAVTAFLGTAILGIGVERFFVAWNIFGVWIIVDYTLMILFFTIAEVAWKKREIRRDAGCDWYFVMIMLGQFLANMPNFSFLLSKGGTVLAALGLLSGLFNMIILPTVISETEKRKEAERKLLQLKQTYDLEELHCELLVEKQNELVKVRHDFNNQLMAVSALSGSGKTEEAVKILEELEIQLDGGGLF